ncbi:MAG: HEAT repeat domain-containing protein, partial [Dictyoglomus sp.]
DEDVRGAAAKALGEIKDKRAVEPLISALKDEDWYVREAAAYALGEIGDSRAVEPLISALKDKDEIFQFVAKEALKKITGMDFGIDYEKWNKWWQENKEKFGR